MNARHPPRRMHPRTRRKRRAEARKARPPAHRRSLGSAQAASRPLRHARAPGGLSRPGMSAPAGPPSAPTLGAPRPRCRPFAALLPAGSTAGRPSRRPSAPKPAPARPLHSGSRPPPRKRLWRSAVSGRWPASPPTSPPGLREPCTRSSTRSSWESLRHARRHGSRTHSTRSGRRSPSAGHGQATPRPSLHQCRRTGAPRPRRRGARASNRSARRSGATPPPSAGPAAPRTCGVGCRRGPL
mmetsp:Transcript_68898/g.177542  ORF Transcript_68898/g.177542 Transcript_68898/m.177542 type:complete len:241 (-) Transcript_68898:839-1561(-)